MSLHSQDTSSSKVVTVKIDGEDYRLCLSDQQDEHFLLQLADDVNGVIRKMREEVPHVGYPYLLVLACLHLAEKSYTGDKSSMVKDLEKSFLEKEKFSRNGDFSKVENGAPLRKEDFLEKGNFLEKRKVLERLFAIEKKLDEEKGTS